MCGICGIFNFGTKAPADPGALKRSTDAMVHRGPDDEGFRLDGELGLGNRRLSIIDLPGSHQPLSNEDGTVWTTFNGEIYNYRELRTGLIARGHRFRTEGDTETIVHLYEEHGSDCVNHLRGMFAFAVWDVTKRRLLLARDRIGIKPLFYRNEPGRIVFASELRALRALCEQPLDLDPQAIYDFFAFRYVPAPRTVYRGVEKLLPGHVILADANGIRVTSYWDVPLAEGPPRPAVEWRQAVIDLLKEAVQLRLIADVPLGVFLSGGMDSSAVVALMAELGARPLRSFSVGFDEPGYSELPFARIVAQKFGTEHHELVLHAQDLAEDLPRLVALRDEPVAEPADVALYRLSRLAAQSVKVVLAGEGGDELFAGYPKYAADRLAGIVSMIPPPLTRAFSRLLPYGQRRLRLALETLSIAGESERSVAWFASFPHSERDALFTKGFLNEVDSSHPARVIGKYLEKARAASPLKRLLYTDLKVWLPDNLLLRGDQMTMAASLEERVPFLDHKLVELAAGIPSRILVRGFRAKALLRDALAPLLPREILQRKKVGFAVPVGPWFRNQLKPMVQDLLLSPGAATKDYFHRANMERLVREHLEGVRDRQKQLWALLNFELWQRQNSSSKP